MKPILIALLLVVAVACDKIRIVPDTSPPTYGEASTGTGSSGGE